MKHLELSNIDKLYFVYPHIAKALGFVFIGKYLLGFRIKFLMANLKFLRSCLSLSARETFRLKSNSIS